MSRDGDFRSAESIALLKQSDIVVTNPPFSLFREYMAQLVEYKKKFVIIGTPAPHFSYQILRLSCLYPLMESRTLLSMNDRPTKRC